MKPMALGILNFLKPPYVSICYNLSALEIFLSQPRWLFEALEVMLKMGLGQALPDSYSKLGNNFLGKFRP